jgi:YNFM family putative membrane transporter
MSRLVASSATGGALNPPRASAWLALFLGTAGVFADMYTTQSILPVLGRTFGLSPAAAGLTISSVVLAVAGGSLVAGPLSDRIGRKPVIVGAATLLIVPTLLCGLAPSFASLVGLRALQGFLMPGLTSVMIVYVNERFPSTSRGTAMGVYVSGQVLGGLLARFASAMLTDALGWRRALIFFAIPTSAGALALARYLPPSTQPGPDHLGARWSDVSAHLHNPRLLATCGLGFSLFFGFIGIFTYLPFYLTAAPFRVQQGALGLVYLVWGMGIFSPLAGTLAARFGRHRAIAVSLCLAMSGMLLTLVPALPVIVLGLGLVALGMFTAVPSVNLLVGEIVSTARGTASALYLCCYYLGGSVGAVVPGLAWERFAWPGVVALCLSTSMLAMAANYVGRRPLRSARPLRSPPL